MYEQVILLSLALAASAAPVPQPGQLEDRFLKGQRFSPVRSKDNVPTEPFKVKYVPGIVLDDDIIIEDGPGSITKQPQRPFRQFDKISSEAGYVYDSFVSSSDETRVPPSASPGTGAQIIPTEDQSLETPVQIPILPVQASLPSPVIVPSLPVQAPVSETPVVEVQTPEIEQETVGRNNILISGPPRYSDLDYKNIVTVSETRRDHYGDGDGVAWHSYTNSDGSSFKSRHYLDKDGFNVQEGEYG